MTRGQVNLLIDLALVLRTMAPPDGQRIIDRALNRMEFEEDGQQQRSERHCGEAEREGQSSAESGTATANDPKGDGSFELLEESED